MVSPTQRAQTGLAYTGLMAERLSDSISCGLLPRINRSHRYIEKEMLYASLFHEFAIFESFCGSIGFLSVSIFLSLYLLC